MEIQELIDNMDNVMLQAKKVIKSRDYGLGITAVYYTGRTLHVDIYHKGAFKYLVMVNISTESFTVIQVKTNKEYKFLLPLKALKLAFEVYELKKGKTDYYSQCFMQSCLRHLKQESDGIPA